MYIHIGISDLSPSVSRVLFTPTEGEASPDPTQGRTDCLVNLHMEINISASHIFTMPYWWLGEEGITPPPLPREGDGEIISLRENYGDLKTPL